MTVNIQPAQMPHCYPCWRSGMSSSLATGGSLTALCLPASIVGWSMCTLCGRDGRMLIRWIRVSNVTSATIQPRPGADILPDCDDPSFVERESATLRPVQDLVRFLLRPAPATASGSDPGLHETLDACADLTDRLVYVHPMFCMLLRRRTSSPGTRLAFRLRDPRCSDCQRDFQLRTPVRVKTKRVARTWVNKIPPIQHLSCSHPLSPAGSTR